MLTDTNRVKTKWKIKDKDWCPSGGTLFLLVFLFR